ncbi:MAG: hypothetical protein QOE82_1083 [Thermoanaerobaculia bacterium]|jgi:hypothetical protein|nr:hypothetical protein [Thermoanaerobaculia bacterium]
MSDNPGEQVNDKGFWDGGAAGHGTNKESSGRANGYPGKRSRSRVGYRTDVEFPAESEEAPNE